MYVANKKKDILVLGGGLTQGLDDTIEGKAKYSIDFTELRKRFVLSLHYNGSNSSLLMLQKYINLKQKIQK